MTDDTVDPAPAEGAGRPQPRLSLHRQFLQDLSFENPQGAASLAGSDDKPQLQVNLNVDSRKLDETVFEVALKITVDSAAGEKSLFIAEIDYRGVFSLTGVDEKQVPPVLLIEGPRMLFPFARRIVADAVRDGGFPPLMLEPVNFAELFRKHIAQRKAEQDASPEKANGGAEPA